MNCEEVKISLHDFVDETLDEFQKREVESHLRGCNNCFNEYKKIRKFFDALASLPYSITPPADIIQIFSEKLLDRSVKEEQKEPVPQKADLKKLERERIRQEKQLKKLRGAGHKSVVSRTIILPDISPMFSSAKINWSKVILLLLPVVLIAVIYFIYDYQKYNSPWKVITNSGTITINGRLNHSGKIDQGESLFTGEDSKGTIHLPGVGNIIVEENSLLIISKAKDGDNRVFLTKGSINVVNTSNLPDFEIELKNCTVADRGGEFKIVTGSEEGTKVSVNFGFVEIRRGNEILFLDEGYSCEINNGFGIGIPYREEASSEFKNYIKNFLDGKENPVEKIIESAGTEDMLTLLAMIPKSAQQKRQLLFQVLANHFPPPEGVTRMGIVKADEKMLYLWWQEIEWQM
ncbi:MAG: FecR domain-containing protein [Melioribacteraceae bacterium]